MKRTLKQIMRDAYALLWNDIKQAKWVIIFMIAYFAFMKNFLYSTCPSVLLTGYPCPACGMTRAAFCLFRMDFKGAFSIHPFIYAVINGFPFIIQYEIAGIVCRLFFPFLLIVGRYLFSGG